MINKMEDKNKYLCVKQKGLMDCGIASLATIYKYYGVDISLDQLKETLGERKSGLSVYDIVNTAKNCGFEVKAVKYNNLEGDFYNFKKPAIAHVNIGNFLKHYIVIYEMDEEKVIFADPARGIIKSTLSKFLKIWSGVLILMKPVSLEFN